MQTSIEIKGCPACLPAPLVVKVDMGTYFDGRTCGLRLKGGSVFIQLLVASFQSQHEGTSSAIIV